MQVDSEILFTNNGPEMVKESDIFQNGLLRDLVIKVIWESNIALGAEYRTGQGTFEIRVRNGVSARLELGLYIRLRLWLELITTAQLSFSHKESVPPGSSEVKSKSPPDRDWTMQVHYAQIWIQRGWTDKVRMWG